MQDAHVHRQDCHWSDHPCLGGAVRRQRPCGPVGRRLLPRQDHQHGDRDRAGRRLRPARAPARPPHGPPHPGRAGDRAAQHAGRGRPAGGQLHGQRRRRATAPSLHAIMQNMSAYQALGGANVEFDTRKFFWIGNTTDTPNVINSWHTTGIKTIQDVMTQELVVGAPGTRPRRSTIRRRSTSWSAPSSRSCPAIRAATTSTSRWSAARSAAAARTPGRRGSRPIRTGSRRRRSSSWCRSRSSGDPELADVPTMIELAKNEDDRR